jgi:glycosyltransferase involved in cell wall biosynthesis
MSLPEVERIGVSDRGLSTRIPFNLPFQAIGFRKYDVVHINYAMYGIPALISSQIARLPFVETVHGIPQPEYENGYDKLGYLAESWALPLTSGNASLVLADSNYIRDELRRRYAIRSITIPLGVDILRFAPPTDLEARAARQRLGVSEKDTMILYAGRLTPWKDPLTLVRAAKIIIQDRSDVTFHFVGRGPLHKEIISLARSLGIQNRVSVASSPDYFHGLTDYYKAADLFVLPTRKEGFGLVVLEAMASGLCVIASDGGAPPELLRESGILFRTGDHFSLAREILSIISDDTLMRELGVAARERAEKVFTWEKCARAYVQIYDETLGSR